MKIPVVVITEIHVTSSVIELKFQDIRARLHDLNPSDAIMKMVSVHISKLKRDCPVTLMSPETTYCDRIYTFIINEFTLVSIDA